MKRYIKSTTSTEGYVSIWWYDDVQEEVIGAKCLLSEGIEDRGYVQYSDSDNHMTLWKDVISDSVNDEDRKNQLLKSGYRSLERGRVVYSVRARCYQIICSTKVSSDKKVIKMIADECNLMDKQVEIISDVHYDNESTDMQEMFLMND